MQDDKQNRSGIFYTNQKGLMPPLVTTNFITQDQGNCSPRFVRSTMYNVPVTVDMMKQVNPKIILRKNNPEEKFFIAFIIFRLRFRLLS